MQQVFRANLLDQRNDAARVQLACARRRACAAPISAAFASRSAPRTSHGFGRTPDTTSLLFRALFDVHNAALLRGDAAVRRKVVSRGGAARTE